MVQNNIAEEPIDAIINPTNKDFDASGYVFRALIAKAGEEIRTKILGEPFYQEVHISRLELS